MAVSAHRAAEACERILTRLSELRPRSCLSASGVAAHNVLCRRLRYETSRDGRIVGQRPSYSDAMRALGALEEALASLLQGQDETWVAFHTTREYFYHAAPLHQAQSCSDEDGGGDDDGGRPDEASTLASAPPVSARRVRGSGAGAGPDADPDSDPDAGAEAAANAGAATVAGGAQGARVGPREEGASGAGAEQEEGAQGRGERDRRGGRGNRGAEQEGGQGRGERDRHGGRGASGASRARSRARSRSRDRGVSGGSGARAAPGGPGSAAGVPVASSASAARAADRVSTERGFHLQPGGTMSRGGRSVRFMWTEDPVLGAPPSAVRASAWDAFVGDEASGYRSVRDAAIVFANEAELRREVSAVRGSDESLARCRPADARALGARRDASADPPRRPPTTRGRRAPGDVAEASTVGARPHPDGVALSAMARVTDGDSPDRSVHPPLLRRPRPPWCHHPAPSGSRAAAPDGETTAPTFGARLSADGSMLFAMARVPDDGPPDRATAAAQPAPPPEAPPPTAAPDADASRAHRHPAPRPPSGSFAAAPDGETTASTFGARPSADGSEVRLSEDFHHAASVPRRRRPSPPATVVKTHPPSPTRRRRNCRPRHILILLPPLFSSPSLSYDSK